MIYENLGQVAQERFGSTEAWGAYIAALRDKLVSSRSSAISAYNTLKQVRKTAGLPFSTAQFGEDYSDQGAWSADYEAQAVDILAMTKVCVDAANDALSGKRKLLWDDKIADFAIEGFKTDSLRLVYGSQGQVVIVDSSGAETHVAGQVGIAPIAILGIGALAVVQGVGIYLIVDKALDTMQVVANQKTQRTLAEVAKTNSEAVKAGKMTAAQAEKLNTSIYQGAAQLQKEQSEAGRRKEETSDITSAVKTLAWVGLGVGVLYVVAQVIGKMPSMPALTGAKDNPDYTRFRSSYLPSHMRDVPPLTPSGTDLEIWTWEDERRSPKTGEMVKTYYGIAFAGKAGKPLWHHWFGTAASRLDMIKRSIAGRQARLKWREERTGARRDFKHTLKVGDVIYTSWGYDQTNVDFYEIVEAKSKSVVVCKIGSKTVESRQNISYVVPSIGTCRGKTSLHRVGEGNSVKIDNHYAHKWEGKPVYETTSGWGH